MSDKDYITVSIASEPSGLVYDDTLKWSTLITPYSRDSFICPNCGALYISEGSGFIPNCNNCGSVMKRE